MPTPGSDRTRHPRGGGRHERRRWVGPPCRAGSAHAWRHRSRRQHSCPRPWWTWPGHRLVVLDGVHPIVVDKDLASMRTAYLFWLAALRCSLPVSHYSPVGSVSRGKLVVELPAGPRATTPCAVWDRQHSTRVPGQYQRGQVVSAAALRVLCLWWSGHRGAVDQLVFVGTAGAQHRRSSNALSRTSPAHGPRPLPARG
jgi:hypothetical protein